MDKILVVDDVEQSSQLMSMYLVNAGYEVLTANEGTIAIKKAKMFKPDLIILDLIMPKMSGYDICKILKSNEDTKYMLIMVVTSLDSKEAKNRAFELGADEYMAKNFDKSTFLNKVKSLLRVKRLSDQLQEKYAEITEQNKQMDMQLKMAIGVQRSLIQEVNFKVNDVSFVSKYMPALGIGGDIYDIVTTNKYTVSVFIGDVSGHGISAALLTSMLKIMFRNLVTLHSHPDKLLYHMNEEFCNIFGDTDVTVYACGFYALIDTVNNNIQFANAGHALPIFVDSEKMQGFELQSRGRPLGLLRNSIYETKTIEFSKGDLLLFHTDGLCDSFYKDDPDEFVRKLRELLIDIVSDNVNYISSDDVIQMITTEFYNSNESAKYENDDVSIILCRM